MLLLVMQAEREQRQTIAAAILDEIDHRVGHVAAIAHDVVDAGPRDQSPLRPRMPRPNRLVVGVEEIFISWIENPVAP
jgi:hypothetical protein